MDHWYLIQFKPNSHYLAEKNLHYQGFETFLPMQTITRRKGSRFVTEQKPFFPGYMFVKATTKVTTWRNINSTIGVSRIVSFEGKPKPLPLQLVSNLMLRYNSPKNLSEGASVEMLTGPFASFIATVDKICPEKRIWILMDFMGQKTRMQVTAEQLQFSK